MHRFFTIISSILIVSAIILSFGLKILPNHGVLVYGDEKALSNCDAVLSYAHSGYNGKLIDTPQEYIEKLKKNSNGNQLYIVDAIALGENIYQNLESEYSFYIKQVLYGDEDLNNQSVSIHTLYGAGFYYQNEQDAKKISDYWKKCGFSEDEYPFLYHKRFDFYSFLNVPKKEHHYIVAFQKIFISNNSEPIYYFCFDDLNYFDELTTNDKLITMDAPFICNYLENETFFWHQEDLDSYYKLKNALFNYFSL